MVLPRMRCHKSSRDDLGFVGGCMEVMHLNICGFWCPEGSWDQSPADTQGQLCSIFNLENGTFLVGDTASHPELSQLIVPPSAGTEPLELFGGDRGPLLPSVWSWGNACHPPWVGFSTYVSLGHDTTGTPRSAPRHQVLLFASTGKITNRLDVSRSCTQQ